MNNYVLGAKMADADRVRATWSKAYPGSALLKTSLRASATQQFLLGNYDAAGEFSSGSASRALIPTRSRPQRACGKA